jgi:hypothetical protein
METPTPLARALRHPRFTEEEPMSTTSIRALVIATTLAGALAAPLAVGTAQAKGDAVTHRGQCSGTAAWQLTAKHDDGRIEVEWQVDANRAGQTWTVGMRDNGALFFYGQRTTLAPSGSFSITKLTADRAGSDVIRVRSVLNTQVCIGTVTV